MVVTIGFDTKPEIVYDNLSFKFQPLPNTILKSTPYHLMTFNGFNGAAMTQ
jgi:hypothetical protein